MTLVLNMSYNCDTILFILVIASAMVITNGNRGKITTSRNNQTSRVMSPKIVFEQLVARGRYHKQETPSDGPTTVELGIYINSFYDISEQTMDYSLNIYLRQRWTDPRLRFNAFKLKGKMVNKIKLADGAWKKIWTPDVFFRNEKEASFHKVTTPNRLIFLDTNGTVWYVSKITAALGCPMKLHKYPLDTQECPMMFESFGYTMDDIIYAWLPDAVEYEQDLELPQFRLTNHTKTDCSQNYTTGAYPCLQIIFTLKRDIGYYMIQLYIPSVLIVILSWVAFWISIEAIPARVTIGLLTVLTMTTQSSGARTSLPRVSYIKAIDVWMSVCLLFVFASLLEFAVVNVFSRKEMKHSRRGEFRKRHRDEDIALEQINIVTHNGRDYKTTRDPPDKNSYMSDPNGKHKARYIDKLSRKLFPLAFLSFNLIYWLSYILG